MIARVIPLLLAIGSLADQLPVALSGSHEVMKLSQTPVTTSPDDDSNIQNGKDYSVLTTQGITNSEVLNNSVCYHPFQNIGNGCYYFSDDSNVERDFDGAIAYCDGLSHGHPTSDISLAMLDYDNDEDLAVLDAISTMDNKYWVGGSTADGLSWEWLDGREVYITAPFWYTSEPNEAQNKCMIAQTYPHGNFKSGQLYDYNCGDSINFICQARKNTYCPNEFRRIGNYCYFVSEELNIPELSWPDAQDYCKALSVPLGYHADLAVLGLPDQGDTYRLMDNLMESSTVSWVGALGDSDCNYAWVTGETIPASTFYWFSSDPNCGSTYRVVIYRIPSYHNRTFLHTYTETDEFPFICQMYPGNN